MSFAPPLLLTLLLTLAPVAQAAPFAGAAFAHGDWELVCDNTRTCRAAGYHAEGDDEPPMSVLLTRQAGPGQAVTGQLMVGQLMFGGEGDPPALPADAMLSMRINGKDLGQVALGAGVLSSAQVAALVAALARQSTIEWSIGEQRWRLSDQGAAAVLLKMDDVQGRVGTRGALLKPGQRDESKVPPAVPAPVVIAQAVPAARPPEKHLADLAASPALRKALRATVEGGEECLALEGEAHGLTVTRLTPTHLLVSGLCWMAAYNAGSGYWVIREKPPFRPVLVTTAGTDYNNGQIASSHKGRGVGDCWSHAHWTWNGQGFPQTEIATTGACKLVAAGGTWSLPTWTTQVRPGPR
jgi:hypothetical protein